MKKIILATALFLFYSCNQIEPILSGLNFKGNLSITEISRNTATATFIFSESGYSGKPIFGICWSTNENPTYNDSISILDGDFTGESNVILKLNKLSLNTKYYVRAFGKGDSGIFYGDIVSFSTLDKPATVKDIDGNVYQTIQIGNQVWLVENLRTTRYNDGTLLKHVPIKNDWRDLNYDFNATGEYCYYDNNYNNSLIYGCLYSFHTWRLKTNLAPIDWHIATESDFNILRDYVSNHLGKSLTIAKALSATTNWKTSTYEGSIGNDLLLNNSSGFKGLPGGCRYSDGSYVRIGESGVWGNYSGDSRYSGVELSYNSTRVWTKDCEITGCSVRCVLNN